MDLLDAREAYFMAFGNAGPMPYAVDDDAVARELMAAVKQRKEIPPDFDWWADLPAGAVA